MEIVVAITGASGVAIGVRLLQVLAEPEMRAKHQVHALVTPAAEQVLDQEMEGPVQLEATYRWDVHDLSAPIASSSRAPQVMAIVPCSMKTLAAVAHGLADDLIVRVAEVMLRMHRPLVLMPRETPLSLPAVENMRLALLAGAVLLPPVMAYYPRPQTVDEVTDFFAGKVLDVLGIEHRLYRRWREVS